MAERIKKVLSKFLSVIRPLIRILAGGGEHINFIHYQVNQNFVILALTTHPPQITIEKQDLVPMGT